MNPQEQEHTPSFELPQAQSQDRADQALPEQYGTARTEQQSSVAVEHGVSTQLNPMPQAPLPQATQGPGSDANDQSATGNTTQGASLPSVSFPPIADDTDLIEKEWVMKAKEIVAQTAHDPHLQNKEMNKFKADYLKKRYNKEIKLSED